MASGIHYWPHLLEMTEEQCRSKLRCMELEAYSCIVAVLRARGPLTDEKANFMKQCAKEFHVSQERHKVEIRKASNSELLSTIAEMLYGPNTETKWFIEGRRLVPILNTEPRQSVYIELANQMAELAKIHNASLPSYAEYKDEPIEVENMHLKEEEEALIQELEAKVKAQEEELKKVPPSPPAPVEVTETSMECLEVMPAEPKVMHPTQMQSGEVMEQEQVVEIKEHLDSSFVVVEEVEQIEQGGVEVKKTLSPRKQDVAVPKLKPPKSCLNLAAAKQSLVKEKLATEKTSPARKKKRSLSIEKYDGSCTPPKRFSNVLPPRIPATPVSQRTPRFQSAQTSTRIMVLPSNMQQPHSSMTHINTGSVRKPMMKSLGPPAPAPPIISKIQRPRMYSTPIKSIYSPNSSSDSPGGNKSQSSPSLPTSSTPVSSVTPASPMTSLSSTTKTTAPSGATGKNNLVLLQKSSSLAKPTMTAVATSTTAAPPGRITVTAPNKKDLTKFMMNKPQSSSSNTSSSSTGISSTTSQPLSNKSVLLKPAGSSSQNNVILVDITQDQLSGNLSVEELLKASGLNQPTPTSKSSTTPLPNIIKLQNPKSLGSLPANIQQIKIIKSSGSKFVLTTSTACSMETVLSLAQSSSASSSLIFTPSSSTEPRMISSLPSPRPRPVVAPLKSTAITPSGQKISLPSPIVTPKVVPSSLGSMPRGTPFGSLTPRSTPSFTSVRTNAPPKPKPINSSSVSSSTSGHVSTGSHLADWLSNYVVSDKDMEEEDSEDDVLFEDVGDKI